MAAMRVLIVEDRPLDGMDLEEVVVLAGHQVTGWATTLRNAMALVEARPPDLAFVNNHLRDGGNRTEFSRRLAERGVAVVITTPRPDQIDDQEHILGVMPKPFATETVQEVLHLASPPPAGIDATRAIDSVPVFNPSSCRDAFLTFVHATLAEP
jgi:AmiR/NasT family two-component response regulator